MAESPPNLSIFDGTPADLIAEIAAHPGLTVVEFGTTTCMPCRRVRQLLPTFAKDNASVQFIVVEVDKNDSVKTEFHVTGVPDIRYFKGAVEGKPAQVAQVVGVNVPEIKAKIASLA
jgi:thioredoxin 1